ncbi:MAG: hypothetical protein AAFZ11_00840 [Pseudomonadota bacterium]
MSLGKLTKRSIEPARVTPAMIAELDDAFGVHIGEGTPAVTGYYDARGKLRRIVAQYPDGWRMQLNIDAVGYVTSTSGKLKLTASSSEAVGGKNA